MSSKHGLRLAFLAIVLTPLTVTVAQGCPSGTVFSGGAKGGFCLVRGQGFTIASTCRVAQGACASGEYSHRSKNEPIRDYCCPGAPRAAAPAAPQPPRFDTSVGGPWEANIDRPGGDYRSFNLPSAHPSLCRDACQTDSRCRAWTYVNPGVQGPAPRCWLKASVPGAVRSQNTHSGVVDRGPGPVVR
jgi:hypothetical protein